MSLHISVAHSFWLLSDSLSYGYTTVYLFTCWWTFGLFQIFATTKTNKQNKTKQKQLLWTFTYKSLYRCLLSSFLGKYLSIGLLGHKVGVNLTFYETAKLFSAVNKNSSSLMFSPTLGMGSHFNFRYYNSDIVVLDYMKIYLMINDIEYLSCAYLSLVHIHWWSVSLDLLPTFY